MDLGIDDHRNSFCFERNGGLTGLGDARASPCPRKPACDCGYRFRQPAGNGSERRIGTLEQPEREGRLRLRLRELVRAEVAQTVSSAADLEAEMGNLLGILSA